MARAYELWPRLAEQLAEWAATDRWPDVLAPFSASRFASL